MFLPVIHVEEKVNTLKNVAIALEAKVDGIFLISHGHYTYMELMKLGSEIKVIYPELWIGYNFLGVSLVNIFPLLGALHFYPDGIWIDNSMAGVEGKKKSVLIWLRSGKPTRRKVLKVCILEVSLLNIANSHVR